MKCAFLLLVINITFLNIEIKILSKKIIYKNQFNFPYINSIFGLFNYNISPKTILIFEPFLYHYECTPGFAKYFIDLGYDVDIIMHDSGLTSFGNFEFIDKIRFFIFNDERSIKKYSKFLRFVLINYNYVLIETANPNYFPLYKLLNLINIQHSFFVFHHLEYLYSLPDEVKLKQKQIWTLGNFNNSIQVNPHYFGNIIPKIKNKITKFFITSTKDRNYEHLISAVEKIKNENLDFHIIVVGKWNTFTKNNISEKVKDNFTFKYNISYSELYNEVNNSDFIIINLDPNKNGDDAFKKTRVSGSVQLAYGFLKPVIINNNFAKIYNFNSNNSFIYNNSNFIEAMKKSIKMGVRHYKKMQDNLRNTANNIYLKSLNNVKICLNEFL